MRFINIAKLTLSILLIMQIDSVQASYFINELPSESFPSETTVNEHLGLLLGVFGLGICSGVIVKTVVKTLNLTR